MSHEFSWRKALEATAVVAVAYVLLSPFVGFDTTIFGLVKNLGSFLVIYVGVSKLLERISEEE